jgi:hypothetical protein
MMPRLCAAVAAVLLAAPAPAGDDGNPFRTVKVGDFAVYKLTTTGKDMTVEATATRTVAAKDDKEAVIRMVVKIDGAAQDPLPDEKIDLTKPYDPTRLVLPGADIKIEKVKDGTEKVKVPAGEFDCRWDEFRLSGKLNGLEVKADVKVWSAKDVPLHVVKMRQENEVAGMKFVTTRELVESGHKK